MNLSEADKTKLGRVSDELAQQPKQDGAGTEDSKNKRSEAEKAVRDEQTDRDPTTTKPA